MKLKRCLLSLFIIGSIFQSATAQYAYITPTYQTIQSKTFKTFAENYSLINKAHMETTPFKSTPGVGFSIGGLIKDKDEAIFALGANYTRNSSVTNFYYNDGAIQKFKFKNNFFSFDFGLPITLMRFDTEDENENAIKLTPEIGATLGSAKIISETQTGEPINGSLISGNFKGFHANLIYGGSLSIGIFHGVGLRFGARKFIPMFPAILVDKSKDFLLDRLGPGYSEDVTDDFRYIQYSIGFMIHLE